MQQNTSFLVVLLSFFSRMPTFFHEKFTHKNRNNNNNEYFERLTRRGPKRLHVLYKYILSKFNAYNMNAHTHARTHRLAHARNRETIGDKIIAIHAHFFRDLYAKLRAPWFSSVTPIFFGDVRMKRGKSAHNAVMSP